MADDSIVAEFTNVRVKIAEYPMLAFKKITFTNQKKEEADYTADSDEPNQYIGKEWTRKYKADGVHDHAFLDELADRCINEGYTFPMIVLGKGLDGSWDNVLATAGGCRYLGGDDTFGDKNPPTRSFEGTMQSYKRGKHAKS